MARYDSYILRTWRSIGPHGAQWSGCLEHVQGGEALRFSDPRLLLSHLQQTFTEKATLQAIQDGDAPPPWRAEAGVETKAL